MLILINVKFKMIEIAVSDNMKWFAFRIIQIQSSSSYLKRLMIEIHIQKSIAKCFSIFIIQVITILDLCGVEIILVVLTLTFARH